MAPNNGAGKSAFEGEDGLYLFDAEPVVQWPVKIRVPIAGGKVRELEVEMDLLYADGAELQTIAQEVMQLAPEQFGTAEDPLAARVVDWSGLGQQGAKGKAVAVPCTEETKAVVMKRGPIRNGVYNALFEMAMGAEAKNSETPPAAGPNRRERRAAKANGKSGR